MKQSTKGKFEPIQTSQRVSWPLDNSLNSFVKKNNTKQYRVSNAINAFPVLADLLKQSDSEKANTKLTVIPWELAEILEAHICAYYAFQKRGILSTENNGKYINKFTEELYKTPSKFISTLYNSNKTIQFCRVNRVFREAFSKRISILMFLSFLGSGAKRPRALKYTIAQLDHIIYQYIQTINDSKKELSIKPIADTLLISSLEKNANINTLINEQFMYPILDTGKHHSLDPNSKTYEDINALALYIDKTKGTSYSTRNSPIYKRAASAYDEHLFSLLDDNTKSKAAVFDTELKDLTDFVKSGVNTATKSKYRRAIRDYLFCLADLHFNQDSSRREVLTEKQFECFQKIEEFSDHAIIYDLQSEIFLWNKQVFEVQNCLSNLELACTIIIGNPREPESIPLSQQYLLASRFAPYMGNAIEILNPEFGKLMDSKSKSFFKKYFPGYYSGNDDVDIIQKRGLHLFKLLNKWHKISDDCFIKNYTLACRFFEILYICKETPGIWEYFNNNSPDLLVMAWSVISIFAYLYQSLIYEMAADIAERLSEKQHRYRRQQSNLISEISPRYYEDFQNFILFKYSEMQAKHTLPMDTAVQANFKNLIKD